jgi:hypothetical protein
MGKDAHKREQQRQERARTPEKAKVRLEQLQEASRLVKLAWDAGVFDGLDKGHAAPVKEDHGKFRPTVGWLVLKARVADAVEQLLQGQYPEVHGYATPYTTGWERDKEPPERPKFRIQLELRPWLRDARLRPKKEVR